MAASNRKRTVKKGKNSRGTTSRQETAGRDYFVCDPGSLCDSSG